MDDAIVVLDEMRPSLSLCTFVEAREKMLTLLYRTASAPYLGAAGKAPSSSSLSLSLSPPKHHNNGLE
jgi:hypothetical protein